MAHVGLPRVAAGFAAAAGVLLAAEGAADFRAAAPGENVPVPATINFGNLIPLSPTVGSYASQLQVSIAAK